jgi:pSer/pThr/pTyr-binding forkhead associated (FHA) protein
MASLVVTEGPGAGKSYRVERAVVLGREKTADIQVGDVGTSREHAKVFSQDGDWFVIDLNSRNGTSVNGSRISRTRLAHGDVISIGKVSLRFDAPEAVRAEAPPAAAPRGAAAAASAAPSAPRGPSALERERERIRLEAESKRGQGPRAVADDGSGVVIRETVLQYGRIENKGGLLREDVGQRGGLFRVALVIGFLGLGTLIVWGIVTALDKDVVEDPNVPEAPAGG